MIRTISHTHEYCVLPDQHDTYPGIVLFNYGGGGGVGDGAAAVGVSCRGVPLTR